MRLFHGTDNAEIQRPTVLTLGVFDGLHLGHQLIMRTVVERARALGAVPTVITFDPHPRAVLHPESAPPLLQTFDQKIEALGVLGIEQTIVVRFTEEFSAIRAEDFLRDAPQQPARHPGPHPPRQPQPPPCQPPCQPPRHTDAGVGVNVATPSELTAMMTSANLRNMAFSQAGWL